MSKTNFRTTIQHSIYAVINPAVKMFIKMGLTPNAVTLIGLILNIGVAIIFVFGAEKTNRGDLSYIGWAGALVLFAGLFDMLDGQVARLGNMGSSFGALFDSVLDRYSELILFLGICYYLIAHHYFLSSLFAFIALIGSLMVSYTRARAEGLGVECKDGLMQRPERVITIGITAVACGIAASFSHGNQKWYLFGNNISPIETISIFTFPLTIMAVLTNYTAVSRLLSSKKALDAKDALTKNNNLKSLLLVVGFSTISSFFPQAINAQNPISKPNAIHKFEAQDTFPVPPTTAISLFYLQRTTNTNTIVVDLNLDKNGEPNDEDPVHVYWIRYPEGGVKKELNYIQRVFAYGIKSTKLSDGSFEMHFVSSRKRNLFLAKDNRDGKYHVYTAINGKRAILKRIFVKINSGGTFWKPNVEYIEFKGIDPNSSKEIIDRIQP
ncbi:MAG: DUF4833 domain-containing protein [Chitinophagaceae bacterium]